MCGTAVELQANLEIPAELPLIAQSGAHGVGLLRSEFLFMNRDAAPDEAAQTEIYAAAVEAMAGDPVTIRVLDWGGDKEIEALAAEGIVPDAAQANPALGGRGIRMLLRHPALLETQFAAILRAASGGPVRVLLPMVTNVGEVRQARQIYLTAAIRLRRAGVTPPDPLPPLGVMIEVPAAALCAGSLAKVADFFSIGSNDLTMYTLAADRGGNETQEVYDPLHPSILRLIHMTVVEAVRAGIPVSICGEMAAQARNAPLLLGIGLRSISVNATAVPRVKQAVRNARIAPSEALAAEALDAADAAAVGMLIRRFDEQR